MSDRVIGDVMLKVDNISLSFGVMKVLDNISFDVHRGECFIFGEAMLHCCAHGTVESAA